MDDFGYDGTSSKMLIEKINKFFNFENNGSDIKTEALAGITTFLSAMYIIVVNPAIVQGAGMPFSGVLTATVLVSAFSSIAMGLYAKNPIVIAPGMSINHMFAYAVVKGEGVPWSQALGCIFWAGVVFLLLTLFDRQKRIVRGIPPMLRFGMAGGIGLFIALIGFESASFIVKSEGGALARGEINIKTLTFLAGLLLTSVMVVRKVPGGFALGIIFTTLLSWPIGRWWGCTASFLPGQSTAVTWTGWWAAPDFSLIFTLDLIGSLQLSLIPIVFVFLFTCMFDSLATCVGICEAGNLMDEDGNPRRISKSLRANAFGMTFSAILGTSPATCYIESSTGVKEGGRTGLTAVVAGCLFLPFLVLSPLLSLVPPLATAPVLVLAGVFMLKPLIYVRWERFDDAIPFFLAMILMPLTYSITQGIVWGCLSWTVLKIACGKWEQVPPALWIMDVVAILLLLNMDRFSH